MHRIPQQGYKKKKSRVYPKQVLCREIPQQDRASVLISKIERAKEGKSVGPNEGTGHKTESWISNLKAKYGFFVFPLPLGVIHPPYSSRHLAVDQ